MYGRPFENEQSVCVLLPKMIPSLSDSDRQQVSDVQNLFEEHRGSLERELGAKFYFSDSCSANTPKWIVGPYNCNPEIEKLGLKEPVNPQIYLDRKNKTLITHGKSSKETIETYSYIRSLSNFDSGFWDIKDCSSSDEAIEKIKVEIGCSYPAFQLRNLNWEQICDRHIPNVRSANDPIPAMQRWLAELQDAHTWVRPFPPLAELPYDLHVKNGIGSFYNVPKNSMAWSKGVRTGFKLIDQDYQGWWDRTSAPPHSKPWIVGKRILSSAQGKKINLRASDSNGNIIEWEDEPLKNKWEPLVTWKKLISGNGYLKIQAWMLGHSLEEKVDEALSALKQCEKLIVDLRGNPGGNLLMAQKFRNRFLKEEGVMGWIQSTLPCGELSEKEKILGIPASSKQQWKKPVVFLTDPLTYSASEDVLLGLQGLKHVKVVGQRSGGGSGRMRLLRLLPGYRLTISTALTFDINGNCIEGAGIPVDYEIPISMEDKSDQVLEYADKL